MSWCGKVMMEDFRQRHHLEECIYCGYEVEHIETVPTVDDEEQWATMAREHREGCEWIETRAHQREEEGGG